MTGLGMGLGIIANRMGGGGGGPSDPDFADVVLLMGFEGADGSTSFTEESDPAQTMSAIGSAEIDTAQFKFGSSSLYTPNGSLVTGSAGYASAYNVGGNPFTVECFARWATVSSGIEYLMAQYDTNSQRSWTLLRQSGALKAFISTTGAIGTTVASASWVPSANTWYHVALDYDGTAYRTFADGVMIGKTVATNTLHASTAPVSIGAALNGGAENGDFGGWIDEPRITIGVSRYGSDTSFTPPTAAFPRS